MVEAGGGVQLARNEGTEPLVLHVVYFDVPVGGAFRIDKPEPSTCTGLAPVPTAALTPTAVPTAAPTATPAASAPPDAAMPAGEGSISPGLLALLLVTSVGGAFALTCSAMRNRRTDRG